MRDRLEKYRRGLPGPDGWPISRQAVDDCLDGKPEQNEAFKWVLLPVAGVLVSVVALLVFR